MQEIYFHTPSFQRLLAILQAPGELSLLRRLEYEWMRKLGLHGRVLDFGGGGNARYAPALVGWASSETGFVYESANIDAAAEPTFVLSEGERLPIEPASYDFVISLNTLEHVYDLRRVLAEIYRVLKDEGQFVFVVPFVFRVHGHPDDFLRGTPSFWQRLLREFSYSEVRIEALTWGPFSTAHAISGAPGPLKGVRRTSAIIMDWLYFLMIGKAGQIVRVWQDDSICNAPIAYCVAAKKSAPMRDELHRDAAASGPG